MVVRPTHGLVWTLADKGFAVIKEFLPELKAAGFKTENPSHDLFVMAAHLGEYLVNGTIPKKDLALITEQQLRCVHSECHPHWFPIKLDHRPDGYWAIRNGDKARIVALEVELSKKSKSRYNETLLKYSIREEVNAVVWVVETEQLGRFINQQDTLARSSPKTVHQFILLSDFFENGWDSKVYLGSMSGHKFRDILATESLNFVGSTKGLPGDQGHIKAILDTKLKRINPTVYNSEHKDDWRY